MRVQRTAIVPAPQYFLLQHKTTHRDICFFLDVLRRMVLGGINHITIDFRRTKKVYAGGMLLVYAELNRLVSLSPNVSFRCLQSRNNTVSQVLKHIGVYDLLKCQCSVVPRRMDVINWRQASADQIDCTGAGKVLETYDALTQKTSKLLYRAASEAIANVVDHAYDGDRGDGFGIPERKTWWLFCREEQNKFYVSVCDLGVGIPNTLAAKNAPEVISKIMDAITLGAHPSDADMIAGAIEYARSRTDESHRGKGFMDIKRVLKGKHKSTLHIFSNRGLVSFEGDLPAKKTRFSDSICGTLIVWSISLTEQEEIENETL
jgi:hypothetical protein